MAGGRRQQDQDQNRLRSIPFPYEYGINLEQVPLRGADSTIHLTMSGVSPSGLHERDRGEPVRSERVGVEWMSCSI